jgi:dodecin
MAIVKVIELMASSSKSWEDAAQQAVTEAAKSLKNIRSVYIQNQSAVVHQDKITEYRVTAKLSFEIEQAGNGKQKKK